MDLRENQFNGEFGGEVIDGQVLTIEAHVREEIQLKSRASDIRISVFVRWTFTCSIPGYS